MIRRWIIPALCGLAAAGLAWQGTLVATPFVLMDRATKKMGGDSKVNAFTFGAPATADKQPIVRPSPDLVYSNCVFDVSGGPVLIRVEPVPGHYWSLSIFDARTDVAVVRSDRDTGGKPAMLALHRAGQAVPVGWEPVELDYDRGIALIRILMADKAEYTAIDALRRRSTCAAAR